MSPVKNFTKNFRYSCCHNLILTQVDRRINALNCSIIRKDGYVSFAFRKFKTSL